MQNTKKYFKRDKNKANTENSISCHKTLLKIKESN